MKRNWIIMIGILFLVLVLLPTILWHVSPAQQVQIAIIDKTVPDESYREHNGVTWVLNYLKFTNETGDFYQASTDYFGFMPNEKEKTYEIRSLPDSYANYDVIYLADTYGVYEDNLSWNVQEREGARSEKIYGGLEEDEWDAIRNRLNESEKSLFIAEYNTFASPTDIDVMNSVTKYLGLEWSGWTGRFFAELNPEKNVEIPQWVLDEYKDGWNYEGPGFILVNDINYEVVVLEEGKHIDDSGIRLVYTDEGKDFFGLKNSLEYTYWFDVVTPRYGSTVLANYEWDLKDEGRELLEAKGIPDQFAAVIASEHGASRSYYFAGDYNDMSTVPRFYQVKGLPTIYNIFQKFSDYAFYWSAYVPMIHRVFEQFLETDPAIAEKEVNPEVLYNARIHENKYEVRIDDTWEQISIKGVNLGMGKPAAFPGEAAITKDEYYRWFEQIGAMNANTIRVYTLHPPGFYEALKEYNENHEKPIYLFHGVWINEEVLVESGDAFLADNVDEFQEEMKRIVDVIHGNVIVDEKPGHASGVYRADIADYVIGWILGIEWDPFMTLETNEKNQDIGDYDGTYFYTKNAQPFEYWLAEQMDVITTYEMENYQTIRPMSFTNWVTTDLLEHPADSSGMEDIVTINPNVIYTKKEMQDVGQFASYHIYPYYPDFLNYEERYYNYIDHRGKKNNYAAYLEDLQKAHELPILVAEFGVPTSRGKTHENPFGWNQGFIAEDEQGEIVRHLYEDIMERDMLGGLIFTWQDEWFKRTWNTMDYDNPNRRPFWSNAQTSEQYFGLLSFDRNKIKVDGEISDWKTEPLYDESSSALQKLYVDYDERFLYFRIDYDPNKEGAPLLLLDIVPEQGNNGTNEFESLTFSNGVDFLIDLRNNKSHVLVDEYYDLFTYHYKYELELVEPLKTKPKNGSNRFTTIHYVLNREYYIPIQDVTLPFSTYETGKLKEGNGNPTSPDYDSLADYYVDRENGVIELRIPWLLLNAKDPSQKEFMGDMFANGLEDSVYIDEIFIGALYVDEEGNVIDSYPARKKGILEQMKSYTWDNWDEPQYEERLKQSYYIVKELFSAY